MNEGRGEGSGLEKQQGSGASKFIHKWEKGSGESAGEASLPAGDRGWIRGEAEREGEQRGREERSRSSAISLPRGAAALTLCRGACRAAGERKKGGREGMKEGTRTERRSGRPMPAVRGRAERAAAKSASLRRGPAMCRACAKICVVLTSSCPGGGGRGPGRGF